MKPRLRDRRGQELVELALVLPLLLLLLAGGIEFGRAFYTYNILTKSVRNAARYLSAAQLSATGTIPAAYITNTRNLAVYGFIDSAGRTPIVPGLTTSAVDVTVAPPTASFEYYVTVGIRFDYAPVFRFLMPTSPRLHPKETMLFVGYIAGS